MSELPDTVLDEARQGVWCPKLCTHACPVSTATGHQVAVPWAFHRAVVDLDTGRLPVADVADRLHECSGCLGCRDACTYDQDVPVQVRAARALAPISTDTARQAIANLEGGRRPDGTTVHVSDVVDADIVLLAGCHDDIDDVMAAGVLLMAAGRHVRVVAPEGCCGAVARDLGDVALADRLGAATADGLPDLPVTAIDPHCEVPGVTLQPLLTVLSAHLDDLPFDQRAEPMTVHDPCLSARRDDTTAVARQLLTLAGIVVVEPEGSGADTICSGAGMSLPLVDPAVAATVAHRRASLLGDGPVVTWCGGAASRLRAAGSDVRSLWQTLADRLVEDPT